ncbi:uncharacterized protein LOC114128775 isoform X2 [Aphis gossypii]|uniref:uncharacterized protein LOC114128775 isoform X2 n=1 Tax=Aphis gossypii TaxID=80765 RepID=UPI00215924C5|nr:uncharacterized protein LOC114128775 isoform X2 [Aphis gossypii]
MYISLGLLWLGFKIIHGEIINCPIGGLTNDQICKQLTIESVLYKFYTIADDSSEICTENTKETLDNLYIGIDDNEMHEDKRNEKKNQDYVQSIKTNLSITEATFQLYVIFRKSLILDDTIPIETRWIEALKIGTDTYRIKFHEKLVYQYALKQNSPPSSQIWSNIPPLKSEKNQKTFSKEYMVLIQSYYNAASTYYFSMKYKLANRVIDDGLNFFISIRNQLYDLNTSTEQEIRHARIWYILLQTLKVDITKYVPYENTLIDEETKLLDAEEEFFLFHKSFPSSAVLLFRRYFLDKDIDTYTRNKLKNYLDRPTLWNTFDDDILYRDHISMYKFLVFFNKSVEDTEKLINIFEAIKRPVLSTEDRLLNYEATKLALEIVKPCIDLTTSSSHTDECSKFQEYIDLESIIISKLRILHDLEKEKLIEKLIKELTTNNHIIEQNVLHSIVTAAIDIDTDSDKYKTNLKNVKKAIELLDTYVEYYDRNLQVNNEIEDEKSNVISKRTTENKFSTLLTKEQLLKKLANTIHTTDENVNNLFIAYKWLMELNGVVVGNDLQTDDRKKEYLDKIKKLASEEKRLLCTESIKTDAHYMYLKTKLESKSLLSRYDWEASNRPSGWISSMPSTTKSKNKNIDQSKAKKMIKKLIYLLDKFECPYINMIEIFTIIFRYFWILQLDYVAMYQSIKSAITEIVVTPEDHLRNFEANELLTMYLVQRNEFGIKMANVIDVGKVYKTFLLDPDFREKV